MIQDLSFPRKDSLHLSVNAGVNSDDFPTAWGTFTIAADLILSLPPGARAATFDISAAYRITPVRPDQQASLCIQWEGKVYVDRAVMFGLASSAGVFGSIADMLVALYQAGGWPHVIKWVDDFFVIQLPGESWSEEEFMAFTGKLGVPWSPTKIRPLSTRQKYIGFIWDLDSKSVALPADKLAAVMDMLHSWIDPSPPVSAKGAASFHGKLVHISSIFSLIRPFLRGLALFAASFAAAYIKKSPSAAVKADLSWVRFIIQASPKSLPLQQSNPIDVQWWGDASSSFGVGVVVSGVWDVWQWTDSTIIGPGRQYDIGWAEAVAVELGLRLVLHLNLPTVQPGVTVLVRSDNKGVVGAVNRGRSRNAHTNRILKEIYKILAASQIKLSPTYVQSGINRADSLSRGQVADFLSAGGALHRSSVPLPDHLLGLLTPWSG